MARARNDPRDVLASNTLADGECLLWTGSATRDGYGVITIGRKQFRAHRIAYEVASGEAADGRLVCHRCDRPLCVAPSHLFLGTAADNTQDMISKGRSGVLRGLDHPNTKIGPAQRDQIRAARAAGQTLQSLADAHGVVLQTISAICRREANYAAR